MPDRKTVGDVMLPISEYATIGATGTIRDALLALDKAQMGLTYDRHHHRAVLVLGAEGQILGKLTHWAILRTLEPRLFGDGDIESLRRTNLSEEEIRSILASDMVHKGSLTRLCAEASRVAVTEAMVTSIESIDHAEPLLVAIGRFVSGHMQSLLVTRDDRVVGILRLSDVFEDVADLIRGQNC